MFDSTKPPLSFRQFLVAPFSDISVDKASGFLRGNFFFLVWILIVPLLMFGVKQGWELFYGLFDDVGGYPGFRAASTLIIYFLLAMAIWLLPMPIFRKASMDELNKLRPVTKDNPYRGLLVSSLPMVFYSIAMIWVQAKRGYAWWQWLLMTATIVAGLYGIWWVMERSKWRIKKLLLVTLANWALVYVLILLGKLAGSRETFWNYYFIGLCLLIQMALLGGLIKQLEINISSHETKDKYHRVFYLIVFLTVVVGTLAYSLVNNLNYVSPIFVLLIIITCYVLLNDLVIALYVLKKGKLLKYSLTIALVLIGWFIFIRRSEIHNVNYVASALPAEKTRATFDVYFQNWYKNNIAPNVNEADTSEIPIFLVAAQGGGSRAGLWASEILNRLEIESDYKFHRQTFAITSASGGSVGASATLALWRYAYDADLDTAARRQLYTSFGRQMFRRNYLSSQFMQLFVNEVGKRFVSVFKDDVYDRNYEHQRHEALGFANAIRYGYEQEEEGTLYRLSQAFATGDGDSLKIGKKHGKILNYPMQPYLSYWYKAPQQPDTRLPLYFPITVNIQTGKPGYASPIAWNDTLFIDAIDIISRAEKNRPGHSLAMVTATNLSQLFPVMNSYTYISGVGNFMDGGLFENMGLTLLSRIHERLTKEIVAAPDSLIPPSVKKRLKIRVLFLINDEIRTPQSANFGRYNQITATLKAVASSSIQGRNTWWLDYFSKELPDKEQLMEFVLQGRNTPQRDQVPLGRWLSHRSVNSVCAKVQTLKTQHTLMGIK